MRVVTVPEPIMLKDLATDQPASKEALEFKTFVLDSLMSHPQWKRGMLEIKAACDIIEAARKANGAMELKDDDWQKLVETVKNPQYEVPGPYGTQVMPGFKYLMAAAHPQVYPFMLAILDAAEKKT